ncbi:MAG: helix-turn-helix domain-containing protein [Gemmatimonadota bacterium]|jgi:DNA-binding transcriptional ArsR family regulator
MSQPGALRPLEPVEELGRAELLLHPLRQRILSEAREASTAAEIARRIGLPPQKVNYHVRTLADAGFLRPAGEGRKRNLIEKRYRASARSYVLLPRVLGEMGASQLDDADRFGATYLMHLSAVLQEELAAWLDSDQGGRRRMPTLSLESELRFDSAGQRAAFADALKRAVTDVIGRHSAPARDEEGRPRPGRPYRLVVGCYPLPDRDDPRPGPTAAEPVEERR